MLSWPKGPEKGLRGAPKDTSKWARKGPGMSGIYYVSKKREKIKKIK